MRNKIKADNLDFSSPKILRFVTLICSGYLVISALFDLLNHIGLPFILFYYSIMTLFTVLFLSIPYLEKTNIQLGRLALFIILGIVTTLILLANHYAAHRFGRHPLTSPESQVLRSFPLMIIVILIIAWSYSRKHIIVFCAIILMIQVLQNVFFLGFSTRPFFHFLITIIAQTSALLILGVTVELMIRNIRMQQSELKQINSQLVRQTFTQQSLAISRERNRMARELHDTLAHTLSGLTVQLETTKAYWDVDQDTARNMLTASLVTARDGLQETRRSLKALRAGPLEDLGLGLAIRQLVDSAVEQTHINCDCSIPELIPSLLPEYDQCLYRISQEAIANIVQHARATEMSLSLSFDHDRIDLKIKDNGVGFSASNQIKSGHFGIAGMRERIELIGGQLKIISTPDKGTTIHFTKK